MGATWGREWEPQTVPEKEDESLWLPWGVMAYNVFVDDKLGRWDLKVIFRHFSAFLVKSRKQ